MSSQYLQKHLTEVFKKILRTNYKYTESKCFHLIYFENYISCESYLYTNSKIYFTPKNFDSLKQTKKFQLNTSKTAIVMAGKKNHKTL